MAAINFDQPSTGQVSSITQPALCVVNRGVGIRVTNHSNNVSAVVAIANGDPNNPHVGEKGPAVLGISNYGGDGIRGNTNSNEHGVGIGAVVGVSSGLGPGGWFESQGGEGIRGTTKSDVHGAVVGVSSGLGPGGWFESYSGGEGVRGTTHSNVHGGVVGVSTALAPAGYFQGNVEVTGNVRSHGNVDVDGDIRLSNADCAEEFISLSGNVEAGTVMVLNEEGSVQPSHQAYDKKAPGVISGAGGYRPGIVLGRDESRSNRIPIALIGKVYCKVDANYSSIAVGDLLTTSATPGHAMKAADPLKAFGAVIGKALRPLNAGKGLIPILIALQ